VLFFVGIVVPFTIFLTVLMVRGLGSLREITVAILGLYPAIVYRMSSPLVLAGYDEHQHERSLLTLLHGGGVFAPNPSLPVSPHYPGLELLTGVVTRLTGLPVMVTMSLVVLASRLLLVLLIFHAALLVSPSRRGASLVVAFYAASSEFYSFNSGFAYQTLALSLGLGGLFLLRRAQLADYATARRLFPVAVLALIATVVTHHATSWMVLACLIAWTAVSRAAERKLLACASVLMAAATVAWTVPVAPLLGRYLGPIFSGALQTAQAFVAGTSAHHIFGASGGTPPVAASERLVLVVYELSCALAALVCAWIMLSRAFHNRDRVIGLLGALNLAFLLTVATHFDPSVGELGSRAATFLFLPLALSVSLIVQRHPRVVRRPPGRHTPVRPAALVALIGGTAIVYLGGTLLGSNPDWNRLPGPYLASADFRSQDPETMAAVDWAATHLPRGSTVAADRVPAVLLGSVAQLWPMTHPEQGLEPAQLYFAGAWSALQNVIVKRLHIDYLYVDTRLARSLPYVGVYITEGETAKPKRITSADVDKFARVRGLTAVYRHGPVTIYDTAGLGVAHDVQGAQTFHRMDLGPWDAIVGAVGALLLHFSLRRRLMWMRDTARVIGGLATTLAVICLAVFIGGVLFALRRMPGPGFTLGAVATSVVICAARGRADGLGLGLRLTFPVTLNLLIILGVVAGVAGVVIAIHAAWLSNVADVHAILRDVALRARPIVGAHALRA
jgi:hypothetical protein